MVLWAFFNISLIIFHEKSHMGWNTCHTLEQHINEEQNFYLWLIYPFKYKALTSIGCQPHFLDPTTSPSSFENQCHPYLPTAV